MLEESAMDFLSKYTFTYDSETEYVQKQYHSYLNADFDQICKIIDSEENASYFSRVSHLDLLAIEIGKRDYMMAVDFLRLTVKNSEGDYQGLVNAVALACKSFPITLFNTTWRDRFYPLFSFPTILLLMPVIGWLIYFCLPNPNPNFYYIQPLTDETKQQLLQGQREKEGTSHVQQLQGNVGLSLTGTKHKRTRLVPGTLPSHLPVVQHVKNISGANAHVTGAVVTHAITMRGDTTYRKLMIQESPEAAPTDRRTVHFNQTINRYIQLLVKLKLDVMNIASQQYPQAQRSKQRFGYDAKADIDLNVIYVQQEGDSIQYTWTQFAWQALQVDPTIKLLIKENSFLLEHLKIFAAYDRYFHLSRSNQVFYACSDTPAWHSAQAGEPHPHEHGSELQVLSEVSQNDTLTSLSDDATDESLSLDSLPEMPSMTHDSSGNQSLLSLTQSTSISKPLQPMSSSLDESRQLLSLSHDASSEGLESLQSLSLTPSLQSMKPSTHDEAIATLRTPQSGNSLASLQSSTKSPSNNKTPSSLHSLISHASARTTFQASVQEFKQEEVIAVSSYCMMGQLLNTLSHQTPDVTVPSITTGNSPAGDDAPHLDTLCITVEMAEEVGERDTSQHQTAPVHNENANILNNVRPELILSRTKSGHLAPSMFTSMNPSPGQHLTPRNLQPSFDEACAESEGMNLS